MTTAYIHARPKQSFAARVSHTYDPRTGIAWLRLDDDEAGYYVDYTTDGLALTKIRTRETHTVEIDGHRCTCTCRGYTHRGECRHAVSAERMIESGEI